ncbi:hypothetical protein pEaSNUABM50_00357 [Erwinia phage pEa_SNUABM_50]|uniref:Uncharacterized protein n=4 Tax=Eneladusvirus BF TaxID=2560751 RepID=A0A7L8ZNR9_9CAUD|nr:hypothetical protein FDH34_gp361 [Serratia phage BF]QOI71299.1 hypothetical protein pEaSNUABM12_00361 [Erwinia phage pEa_SNUABM_12]QOI71842.1 hypothetical protein pEaSNUABM47_00358 [Erwinia phage pEa_SNUABM_47]QOI72381.1 hypothetical protein pEaSNUABM50_00357 [Erwinia phage pEa_SNUABM_50]QXO11508.1 hypothetical protein pEaSNUABM19_00362 [Erwinia phage pEa_SNUABM_19]QXO12056.1 hypothetical protein pEaSNUABM44_00360 [Erwinia phage pEa_SNUABM_44]QXO12609.1 hypothetical protein pEaSNUABM49_003
MKLIEHSPTKEVQYYGFTFTVPVCIKYAAVDANGTLMGFEDEPKVDHGWQFWDNPTANEMVEMGKVDLEGQAWESTLQVLN